MPKRVPISAVREFAKGHDLRQVIVLAWDGELTHVVTYGKTAEDCDQAAQGGDRLKKTLGWPESLNAAPSRVRALQRRVEELEAELAQERAVYIAHEVRAAVAEAYQMGKKLDEESEKRARSAVRSKRSRR